MVSSFWIAVEKRFVINDEIAGRLGVFVWDKGKKTGHTGVWKGFFLCGTVFAE